MRNPYESFDEYGLRYLPRHLIKIQSWEKLERILTDLFFLEAKVKTNLVFELVSDYNAAKEFIPSGSIDKEHQDQLKDWETFISLSAHKLARGHEPFLQLAYNYASTGPVASAAEDQIAYFKKPWLRLLNRPVHKNNSFSRVLEGHTDVVNAIALTPDGQKAVSGSEDRTLRVWDLNSGRCLQTMAGHDDGVLVVAITPDGRQVVSGGKDTVLRVWDLASGQCLRILTGHTERVVALSIMKDGRAISTSPDGTIRIWDLDEDECLRILRWEADGIRTMALSEDERRVILADSKGTLHVGEIESGECMSSFGYGMPLHTVAITKDGQKAVSSGWDKEIRVWDIANGRCKKTLEGYEDFINALAVTAEENIVISAGGDHALRLWDIEIGECLKVLDGHAGAVVALAVTKDGSRAVSGSADQTIRVWELKQEVPMPLMMSNHSSTVTTVALTPDGKRAISGSYDNTLRAWDLDKGQCIWANEAYTSLVTALAVTPDGQYAVSGSGDFLAWQSGGVTRHIWNIETGECIQELHDPNRLWDWAKNLSMTEDGKINVKETGGSWNWIKGLAVTPDGKLIISSHQDGTLAIWRTENGYCLYTLEGHQDAVTTMAVTPDGRHVVSGSIDRTLRIWDILGNTCLGVLKCEAIPQTVVVNVDGQTIISGGDDGNLCIWDIAGTRCLQRLGGHTGPIGCLSVTPDGQFAVSGSQDMTLRFWDLNRGECLRSLDGHTGEVTGLATTRDGQYVISCSRDKTIRLWSLAEGQQIACYYLQIETFVNPHEAKNARPLTGICLASDGLRIVTGDSGGRVYLLALENLSDGAPVITAWCGPPARWKPNEKSHSWRTLSQFYQRFSAPLKKTFFKRLLTATENNRLAFGCPLCRVWSEIPESTLGTELICQSCGQTIKLNSFTIQADWKPVADAWHTNRNGGMEIMYSADSSDDENIDLACMYAEQGDDDNALLILNRVIDRNSKSARAFYNRGLVYDNRGQFESALADYSKAISLNPKFAQAYTNRGFLFEKSGKLDKAIGEYKRALIADPHLAQAHRNLGSVYHQMGKNEQALSNLTQAIKLGSEDDAVYTTRGDVYADLKRHGEAIADFNRALEFSPGRADLFYFRGNSYYQTEKYQDAITDYTKAIEIDPDFSDACINKGVALIKIDRVREGIHYLDRAIALGNSQARNIKQRIGFGNKAKENPAQIAFDALEFARSLEDMRQLVKLFPIMANPEFVNGIERIIVREVPPDVKPKFDRGLSWLRSVIAE